MIDRRLVSEPNNAKQMSISAPIRLPSYTLSPPSQAPFFDGLLWFSDRGSLAMCICFCNFQDSTLRPSGNHGPSMFSRLRPFKMSMLPLWLIFWETLYQPLSVHSMWIGYVSRTCVWFCRNGVTVIFLRESQFPDKSTIIKRLLKKPTIEKGNTGDRWLQIISSLQHLYP